MRSTEILSLGFVVLIAFFPGVLVPFVPVVVVEALVPELLGVGVVLGFTLGLAAGVVVAAGFAVGVADGVGKHASQI